jgi:hypothetical protein
VATKKYTKAEEAAYRKLFDNGSPALQAQLRVDHPLLFDPTYVPVPAPAPAGVGWATKVGLTKAQKVRNGLSLSIVLHVRGGTVTLTTSELLNVRRVQEALVAVTEVVPVMPSPRAWPAAVELILSSAEEVKADDNSNDAENADQFMFEELCGFLGSGIEAVDNVVSKNASMMAMMGSGSTHGVYTPAGDELIVHTRQFSAFLAQRNGKDRASWDMLARATLKKFFAPYRMAGSGARNFWKTTVADLTAAGIRVPIDDSIGHKD